MCRLSDRYLKVMRLDMTGFPLPTFSREIVRYIVLPLVKNPPQLGLIGLIDRLNTGDTGCHGSLEIWKQVIVNRFFDLEIFWRKKTINSIFYICYTLLMRSRLKSFRHFFFFLKSCSVNNSKIKIQYTFRSLDDGLWSDLKSCLEIF